MVICEPSGLKQQGCFLCRVDLSTPEQEGENCAHAHASLLLNRRGLQVL